MEEFNAVLDNFITAHGESFTLDRQRKLMDIEKIINPVLSEVKKMDENFDFDAFSTNGFYRIKSPSHYEILLNFRGIDPNEISIEDGQTSPGFALVKLTGKKMISRWKFCSGNSNPSKIYLSAKIVKGKLLEYVKRAVNSEPFLKGINGKSCIEVDEARDDDDILLSVSGRNVDSYSLDLIPAIPCPGHWVFSAHAWKSIQHDWPGKKLREDILQSGIHLVARPPLSKSAYQWQICFPVPMKKLLEVEFGCRERCLLILEMILEDMQYGKRGCNLFHLETIAMRVTAQFPVKSFWNDEKLGKRIMNILEELEKCLRDRHLEHVFLPSVNLLRDVDKVSLEGCTEGVRNVLQDPVKFFREFDKCTTSL